MTRAYAPKNPALFDQGLSTRREVLGAEYVDASIQNATDFNSPARMNSSCMCAAPSTTA
jgi:hypothetical protein